MTATYFAPVTVLGAGSYGTALAIALARNGHKTYLWGHQSEAMAKLAEERTKPFCLIFLSLRHLKLKAIWHKH